MALHMFEMAGLAHGTSEAVEDAVMAIEGVKLAKVNRAQGTLTVDCSMGEREIFDAVNLAVAPFKMIASVWRAR